jgi:hypothetical protein
LLGRPKALSSNSNTSNKRKKVYVGENEIPAEKALFSVLTIIDTLRRKYLDLILTVVYLTSFSDFPSLGSFQKQDSGGGEFMYI